MLNPKTIILCSGSELLDGRVRESNGHFLSQLLQEQGISTHKRIIIEDDYPSLVDEIKRALPQAGILILGGGLGPTKDDLSREALAEALSCELILNTQAMLKLKNRFKEKERIQANEKQAFFPKGFKLLENEKGSAPGFYALKENCLIMAFPGPPGELIPMAKKYIPLLLKKYNFCPDKARDFILSSFLIPEAIINQKIKEMALPGLSWYTTIGDYSLRIRLQAADKNICEKAFSQLQKIFSAALIRKGEIDLAGHLANLLKKKGLKLALAESCSGGLVSKVFTDIPGASAFFWGSLVSYSNQAKQKILGISDEILRKYGAVSKECALEMASSIQKISGADLGMAISGIAGPSGGSKEKPLGLVYIAIKKKGDPALCTAFLFDGSRASIRKKSLIALLLIAENVIFNGKRLDKAHNWDYYIYT